jgi:hypothetical protein
MMAGNRTSGRYLQYGETLAFAWWNFECTDAHGGLPFQREKALEADYSYETIRFTEGTCLVLMWHSPVRTPHAGCHNSS